MRGATRRRPPTVVRARYQLVTPAFVAGADNTASGAAELRLPSVLGALRFWWRALAWARTACGGEPRSERQRLTLLRRWEDALFGAANTGQGAFTARMLQVSRPVQMRDTIGGYPADDFPEQASCRGINLSWERGGSGVAYLAGQGLVFREETLRAPRDARPSIPAGAAVCLEFRGWSEAAVRHVAEASGPDEPPTLVEALEVLGLMGGIGARSRRGFGSLRLIALERDGVPIAIPADAGSYERRLHAVLAPARRASGTDDPLTSISSLTRVALVRSSLSTNVRALHNEMGHRFQYYRGLGFKPKGSNHRIVGGVRKTHHEAFVTADHTLMNRIADNAKLPRPAPAPSRTIFGVPYHYRRSDKREIKVTTERTDRRASPLFLHIHDFGGGGEALALWALFEARFLDTGHAGGFPVKIERSKPGADTLDGVLTPDFSVASSFFDASHMVTWAGQQQLGTVSHLTP